MMSSKNLLMMGIRDYIFDPIQVDSTDSEEDKVDVECKLHFV